MSLSIDKFAEFFSELYGYSPFPWQSRLARLVFEEGWPRCIDLPTASGKTSTIDLAVFVLACQADLPSDQRTVGRRIFFTVNRRVIVDEAYDRSLKLACKLNESKDGIVFQVANALRQISGDALGLPLDVVQLRGGIARDNAWSRSITQPQIICTTADQLGSRLLFRGYGVSNSMRPVHAALTACDSLILLDEAHITRAFSQTLSLVQKYHQLHKTSPPMHFVQMTATPTDDVNSRFTLDQADLENPVLRSRQEASKSAVLVKIKKSVSFEPEIAKQAIAALSDQHKAIGIMVNRVQTARKIEEILQKKHPGKCHLVIGRMRPLDRDLLQKELGALVGPKRPPLLAEPCFVISTQCLEVGADYNFDALITECASIDALLQRFGRLNRDGRDQVNGQPFTAQAAIVAHESSLVEDDPIYGSALLKTWNWLTSDNRSTLDFGIAAIRPLLKELPEGLRAGSPDAAVLLPAHLDILCQTAPSPQPEPDVSYFIHGPKRDNLEVSVCWRADLGNETDPESPTSGNSRWTQVVAMLPPLSTECVTVPLHEVRKWMENLPIQSDADVPVSLEDEPTNKRKSFTEERRRKVVIFRGMDEILRTNEPSQLKPGDTLVISAQDDWLPKLGHIPGLNQNFSPDQADVDQRLEHLRKLDLAEAAYETSRRLRIIRVNSAIHPELPKELQNYATSDGETVIGRGQLRKWLGILAKDFTSGPDELSYPSNPDGKPVGLLLRFNKLLSTPKSLASQDISEDDGDDSSIESTDPITLADHTRHVTARVISARQPLHLQTLDKVFQEAARLHDWGKADPRFAALLAGTNPFEAMLLPTLLAKSGRRLISKIESDQQRELAQLPDGFRHEMLSMQLAEHRVNLTSSFSPVDRELLLHLIASHHGHARPFAPMVIDEADDETRSIEIEQVQVTPQERRQWIDPHRLDSGVPERFWNLTRLYGWWGLAWLESILRLADQQASAAEEKGDLQ